MLYMIELYNPFYVIFIDFWELGNIPDWYGYRNSITCMDNMTVFGLGADSRWKKIVPDQVTQISLFHLGFQK